MARLTGIGGDFFESSGDGRALAAWYQQHLGMPPGAGAHDPWRSATFNHMR